MPARLKLETFDPSFGASRPAYSEPMREDAVAEVRLSAYENGYSAGWEDAVAAQSGDQLRIREDLARNLRDLSFTYHEARANLLRGLEPLLRGLTERILPELAHATLGAAVVAEIARAAGHLAEAPVELTVSPGNRDAIEAALGEHPALPVRLVEEPTLGDGQVRFAFGGEERALDLDALLGSIRGLMNDFLDSSDERQTRYG